MRFRARASRCVEDRKPDAITLVTLARAIGDFLIKSGKCLAVTFVLIRAMHNDRASGVKTIEAGLYTERNNWSD